MKNMPDQNAYIQQTAEVAYRVITEWLGTPSDPKWPFEIRYGDYTGCKYTILTRKYIIILGPENVSIEQICSAIGHEIYHRVTAKRKSLRMQMWIDEMLAFLVQQRFLREQGFDKSADQVEQHLLTFETGVDFQEIQNVRRRFVRLGSRGVSYPPKFALMIGRLGLALDYMLEWEDICSLANVQSLEEWYTSLPQPLAPCLAALMNSNNPEQNSSKVNKRVVDALMAQNPEDVGSCLRLAQAFQLMRHFKASHDVLEMILETDSNNAKAMGTLANLLFQQNRSSEAVCCYEKSLEMNPSDDWIRQNYGVVLYREGYKERAFREWEQIVERGNPEHVAKALWALSTFV